MCYSSPWGREGLRGLLKFLPDFPCFNKNMIAVVAGCFAVDKLLLASCVWFVAVSISAADAVSVAAALQVHPGGAAAPGEAPRAAALTSTSASVWRAAVSALPTSPQESDNLRKIN